MADQNLPGFQPRNFADKDYIKELYFSIEREMSAPWNWWTNVVTVALNNTYMQCCMILYYFLDIIIFLSIKVIYSQMISVFLDNG